MYVFQKVPPIQALFSDAPLVLTHTDQADSSKTSASTAFAYRLIRCIQADDIADIWCCNPDPSAWFENTVALPQHKQSARIRDVFNHMFTENIVKNSFFKRESFQCIHITD